MTRAESYTEIRDILERDGETELADFMAHEIEKLEKASSNRSMTANQKENIEIKEVIIAALEEIGEPATISEIQTHKGLDAYSNQRISAITQQLLKDGRVEKTVNGRKNCYSLA